jgi:hypothetical protein
MNLKLHLYLVIAFLLGGATGGLVVAAREEQKIQSILTRGPDEIAPIVANRLSRKLGLDEGQQVSIQPIIQSAHDRLMKIRNAVAPDVAEIITSAADDIRKQLNPEQSKRLDELLVTRQALWRPLVPTSTQDQSQ